MSFWRQSTPKMTLLLVLLALAMWGCQSSPETSDNEIAQAHSEMESGADESPHSDQQPVDVDATRQPTDDHAPPRGQGPTPGTDTHSVAPESETEFQPDRQHVEQGEDSLDADDAIEVPTADDDEEVPSSPTDVSEAEAQDFAAAYTDVIDLQVAYESRLESTSDPDEITTLQQQLETETMEAVQAQDLTIDQFNAISELLEQDPHLRDRIQNHIDSLAH